MTKGEKINFILEKRLSNIVLLYNELSHVDLADTTDDFLELIVITPIYNAICISFPSMLEVSFVYDIQLILWLLQL